MIRSPKGGNYLAELLVTLATLVEKSMTTAADLYDATLYILCGEGSSQRGSRKTLMFDITCVLARRVPPAKLAELDGDIHPSLAALMFAVLEWASEALGML